MSVLIAILPISIFLGWGLMLIWRKKKQISQTKSYRLKYLQLIELLDEMRIKLTSQSQEVFQMKHGGLMDYFENTVKIFENLLEAVNYLPPISFESTQVKSAMILAEDCYERTIKLQTALKIARQGGDIKDILFTERAQGVSKSFGCYFCSRPFVKDRFSMVRVRIESEVKNVAACQVCKEELETTKKIKVLYFMKNGKPVHWSEIEDYIPAEDFWDINKKAAVAKERHLELITELKTQGRSQEEKKD